MITDNPTNIDEGIQWILKHTEGIQDALKEDEDDFVFKSRGLGQWIRNNWGLQKEQGPLYYWFLSLGIKHADDMSDIILRCTHRHYHEKDFDINGQVKHFIEYWKNVEKETGTEMWPKEDNT